MLPAGERAELLIAAAGAHGAANDNTTATARPELAVMNTATGEPWRDNIGGAWLDPSAPGVGEYLAALAGDLADKGFDEVQLDYIRFYSDGPYDVADTNLPNTQSFRLPAIQRVLRVVSQELDATRTFLVNGEVPELGHVIRQPELAATLELLAARGADGFKRCLPLGGCRTSGAIHTSKACCSISRRWSPRRHRSWSARASPWRWSGPGRAESGSTAPTAQRPANARRPRTCAGSRGRRGTSRPRHSFRSACAAWIRSGTAMQRRCGRAPPAVRGSCGGVRRSAG